MQKKKSDWKPVIGFTILFVIVLVLPGCASVGVASGIVNTPAENVNCQYVRMGPKWTLACTLSGTIPMSEGIDFMKLVQ